MFIWMFLGVKLGFKVFDDGMFVVYFDLYLEFFLKWKKIVLFCENILLIKNLLEIVCL